MTLSKGRVSLFGDVSQRVVGRFPRRSEMSEAREWQPRLSPAFTRALFCSSQDGRISHDAISPAVVDVLFHDAGMDYTKSSIVAGLVAERVPVRALRPIHERMARARSHDERHEIAGRQAVLIAQAAWVAKISLGLDDPRRDPFRFLLVPEPEEEKVGQSA